jgi:type IV fimbrial biogenesis protein FimT
VVELLTTIAVLAILAAIAVPGLRSFSQNNRAAAQTNELIAALSLARNEAITRGLPVSVCASADGGTCSNSTDWTGGWIVFTDAVAPQGSVEAGIPGDAVLRAFAALDGDTALTGSASFLSYASSGFLVSGLPVSFALQIPQCAGEHNRAIEISLQGRPTTSAVAC